MTDWQAIRDHVAMHVMGLTIQYDTDPIHGAFADYYNAEGERMGPCEDFTPDTDWAQCGTVIGAMERQGWQLELSLTPKTGPWVKYSDRRGKWDTSHDPCGDTLCQEITLVAAYATGYEAADD